MILTICDKCGKIIMEGANDGTKHQSTIGYTDYYLCDDCEKSIQSTMRKQKEMCDLISEALNDK